MENVGQANQESTGSEEVLLKDPDIVTFTFRRHSNRTGGVINQEGLDNARAVSAAWSQIVRSIPKVEVSFYESPSYLLTGAGKRPVRASITASLYEQAYNGRLAQPIQNEKGELLPGIRTRDSRLGDFLENATGSVEEFDKAVSLAYGGTKNEDFWDDYTYGNLPDDVNAALLACGGRNSLRLAGDLADFIISRGSELLQKSLTSSPYKEIALAITHGENIESFLHYIAQFLRTQSSFDAQLIDSLDSRFAEYNQGFDIHLDKQGEATLVFMGDKEVKFNFHNLKDYLSSLGIANK